MITFITGNAGKFSEAEAILGTRLAQRKADLPEVQSLDAQEVMQAKLSAARSLGIVPCIVEDSALTFDCLGGKLPGPYIKSFEEALGIEGLASLVARYEESGATSSTLVGYVDETSAAHLFEGSVRGTIVAPRGGNDFGYGPAFLPEGSGKTFGEMSREEKHAASSRAIAFTKLKEHLAL